MATTVFDFLFWYVLAVGVALPVAAVVVLEVRDARRGRVTRDEHMRARLRQALAAAPYGNVRSLDSQRLYRRVRAFREGRAL